MRGSEQFERGLRIAMVGILMLPQSVIPATITVQGNCTLVDAIRAANADAGRGGCPAGSDADTIRLTRDVVLGAPFDVANGLPPITSEIRLRGFGYSIAREEGAPRFRILEVQPEGVLTLDDVTIMNGDSEDSGGGILARGDVTLRGSTLSGNAAGKGGGIYGYRSRITLESSTVSGNRAGRGAGVAVYDYASISITGSEITGNSAGSRGGGLMLHYSFSGSTISNSTISYNSAGRGGGLLLNFYSNLDVVDSDIIGNSARVEGGGIYVTESGLQVARTRLVGNSAYDGGGLYKSNNDGVIEIVDSVVARNRATHGGGGLFFGGNADFNIISLTNSTVSGNQAELGGGIYERTGYYRQESSIRRSTITQNEAVEGGGVFFTTAYGYNHPITNTIIAGNRGGNCGGPAALEGRGNMDDDGSCPGSTSIEPGVDFDTELADNGGPTETHALLEGSVAIDTGRNCGLETDQRGFRRDSNCDTGAFEFGAEGLGAMVTGLELVEFSCRNRSARQRGGARTDGSSWLCDAVGVSAETGDRIRMNAVALATGEGAVGGSATGLSSAPAPRITCRNATTRSRVAFAAPDRSWSCEAEGLEVSPGDEIRLKIKGRG